jgi:hypothetical protein
MDSRRAYFDALIIGYYEDGKLMYAAPHEFSNSP